MLSQPTTEIRYAANRSDFRIEAGPANRKRLPWSAKKPDVPTLWQGKIGLLAQGMVLSDKVLFVAGPPDLFGVAPGETLHPYTPVPAETLRSQREALERRQGTLLCAISATDCNKLAEYKLGGPTAALFLSTSLLNVREKRFKHHIHIAERSRVVWYPPRDAEELRKCGCAIVVCCNRMSENYCCRRLAFFLSQQGARVMLSIALLLAGTMVGGALPEEVEGELDYYVGTWTYEWTIDDTTYEGKWSVKWSQDKSCLLSHWSSVGPDGPGKGTKITGWDLQKNQMVDLEFGDGGAHILSRYRKASGTLWEGDGVGATSEGKSETCKYQLKLDPDKFIWMRMKIKQGDESLPNQVFVFSRTGREE